MSRESIKNYVIDFLEPFAKSNEESEAEAVDNPPYLKGVCAKTPALSFR
jgi:hypothetical protein